MQYSPKLKKAMEEIKAVLDKHDIGGIVVIHTPGNAEFLLKVNPSYSCAQFNGDELRVRARLEKDFGGDKKAWEQKVRDTSNMLNLISEVGMQTVLSVAEISRMLDKTVNASHSDAEYTPHKNN